MADEETPTAAPQPVEISGVNVTLESIDDQKFTIPVEAAIQSHMIKTAINWEDHEGEERPTSYEPVPLLRVGGPTLAKVVDFMNQYIKEPMNEIETPLAGNSFEEVRSPRLISLLTSNEKEQMVESTTKDLMRGIYPPPSSCAHILCEQVVQQQWYRDFLKEENVPRELLFQIISGKSSRLVENKKAAGDCSTLHVPSIIDSRLFFRVALVDPNSQQLLGS